MTTNPSQRFAPLLGQTKRGWLVLSSFLSADLCTPLPLALSNNLIVFVFRFSYKKTKTIITGSNMGEFRSDIIALSLGPYFLARKWVKTLLACVTIGLWLILERYMEGVD
jgi:hypothetical protein